MPVVIPPIMMTAAYLSRMIRKETGYSFSEILNSMRLAEAVWLLREDSVKIGLLCEKSGFRGI